jgi:hypothetical protein
MSNSLRFLSLIGFCGVLLLVGCSGSKESALSRSRKASGNTATDQYRDELLSYAINNLQRLEEFDSPNVLREVLERLNAEAKNNAKKKSEPSDTLLSAWPEPEMLRQIVERLNQWARAQTPLADWHVDPMTASLPKPLAELSLLKDVGQLDFSRFDGYYLQEAVWMRDVTGWAKGDGLDDLDRAKCLFDWTVRNIQLESDHPARIPLFPWENLLFGNGTATERAWVFILLARQLGIDAAMLAAEPGLKDVKTEKNKADAKIEKSTKTRARPWCVAVRIEGNVYLFDPFIGLPIPAPDGVKLDENGQLTIQPATLKQVLSDEKLLRRLDVDDTHRYGAQTADLKHLVVQLEASPTSLTQRMKLLESRLVGKQKVVLTTQPTVQAEHWQKAMPEGKCELWLHPFETIQRRSHLSGPEVQARLVAMLPFYGMASVPLRRGRVLYLRGQFVGDDSATQFFQMARPSNAELRASSAHPIEKAVFLRGKQDASYWLGLIAYQRANYPTAIDYFTTRTLLATPNGPWSDGARYNLARTFEAMGDPERAILQYANNAGSPGALGDLLRAKWLKAEKNAKRDSDKK